MKLSRKLYQRALVLLLFIIVEKSHAQLCTGAISDPILTIDFGSIGPRSTPLPQVPAPYQYVNSDCPNDGFYTVRNSTFLCFGSLWHVLPYDHTTGDFDGNFLLVNALPGTTDIYIDTIRGLCSDRTFELGAWVVNVLNPNSCNGTASKPDLTFSVFSITGALLATYNTGSLVTIQPYTWVNHKFQFILPPGSGDVILKISDNAPAGCGNDFALDDITFSPCSGNMMAAFANTAGQEIDVCEENQLNYLLTSSYTGFTNPLLQWQVSYDGNSFFDIPGATNNTYLRTPTTPGTYYYRISIFDNGSGSCKFNSNEVRIVVDRSPFAQATNYVIGCYGSRVGMAASGGSSYQWTGPNGFVSNEQSPSIPAVNFSNVGRYIVKVTTSSGCFSFDTTDLVVYRAPVVTLPFSNYSMCDGQWVQLNASGSFRYRWTPSAGLSNDTIANPIANPSQTTTYIVQVFNEEITCYDTAAVKIIVWSKPHANAGPDKFTYNKKPVLLLGSASGTGISYTWSPVTYLDNPFIIRPQAAPPQTVTYTLRVKSDHGCGIDTDSVKVEVIDKLFIPTAFTPNNDGLNDTWEIITFDTYPDATVEVYNRWGQKVYAGTGSNYRSWDGRFKGQTVLPGSYIYAIRLNKKAAILKGILNVVR